MCVCVYRYHSPTVTSVQSHISSISGCRITLEWLSCSSLLIPSQMRRMAGPTGPPPAKTRGALRVGATGVSGATEQMAAASEAAGEFCSAEAPRRREPDYCRPMEPSPSRRIEWDTVQQDAWVPLDRRRQNFIKCPCKPRAIQLFLLDLKYWRWLQGLAFSPSCFFFFQLNNLLVFSAFRLPLPTRRHR